MGKTLYIQIDNNSLPEGCSEDIEVLDCRCINDFCSMVGDALVGDLKDENGKPYYRLINPVGRLLMDFKNVAEKAFNTITEDWYDILGNLLHNGQQEEYLTIKFPLQYTDWLLSNENFYLREVGKRLQNTKNFVYLKTSCITDEITSALHQRINRILNCQAGDIEAFVISDSRMNNTSLVVKDIIQNNPSVSYVCISDFLYSLKLKRFEDYRIFKLENPLGVEDIILGETNKDDLEDWEWDVFCIDYGLICEFKNDIWSKFSITSDNLNDIELFNEIASVIWGKKVNYKDFSFNEWQQNLLDKGFAISTYPKWGDWHGHTSFMAALTKETKTFVCKLMFLESTASELEDAKNIKGTLWGIDVTLK